MFPPGADMMNPGASELNAVQFKQQPKSACDSEVASSLPSHCGCFSIITLLLLSAAVISTVLHSGGES